MNIWGILPNQAEIAGVRSANKSTTNLNNYAGPSFSESIKELAQSANMQIANGATAGELQFARQKEGFDEPFSFKEAEEELAEEYIARIQKLLKDLNK
jgi:hypothetical protein